MSTYAYAALTGKREEAQPGTSTGSAPPGVKTYVDAFAALVPAEILAAHGVILTFTTQRQDGKTAITAPESLATAFWALAGLSLVLFIAGRVISSKVAWSRWDFVRMLIPPLAFAGWTMLQKATAFDAVFPNVSDSARGTTAVIGGVVLGLLASALSIKADKRDPPVTAGHRSAALDLHNDVLQKGANAILAQAPINRRRA